MRSPGLVVTGTNRSLFFDLQGFLQGQIGLSFSIYKAFTGSNQSPFFDFNFSVFTVK